MPSIKRFHPCWTISCITYTFKHTWDLKAMTHTCRSTVSHHVGCHCLHISPSWWQLFGHNCSISLCIPSTSAQLNLCNAVIGDGGTARLPQQCALVELWRATTYAQGDVPFIWVGWSFSDVQVLLHATARVSYPLACETVCLSLRIGSHDILGTMETWSHHPPTGLHSHCPLGCHHVRCPHKNLFQ